MQEQHSNLNTATTTAKASRYRDEAQSVLRRGGELEVGVAALPPIDIAPQLLRNNRTTIIVVTIIVVITSERGGGGGYKAFDSRFVCRFIGLLAAVEIDQR